MKNWSWWDSTRRERSSHSSCLTFSDPQRTDRNEEQSSGNTTNYWFRLLLVLSNTTHAVLYAKGQRKLCSYVFHNTWLTNTYQVLNTSPINCKKWKCFLYLKKFTIFWYLFAYLSVCFSAWGGWQSPNSSQCGLHQRWRVPLHRQQWTSTLWQQTDQGEGQLRPWGGKFQFHGKGCSGVDCEPHLPICCPPKPSRRLAQRQLTWSTPCQTRVLHHYPSRRTPAIHVSHFSNPSFCIPSRIIL